MRTTRAGPPRSPFSISFSAGSRRLSGGPAPGGTDPPAAGGKAGQGPRPKRKFLENYCISLTNRAQEGKLTVSSAATPSWSRVQILNRRQKNNPCHRRARWQDRYCRGGLPCASRSGTSPTSCWTRRFICWTSPLWWRAPSSVGGSRADESDSLREIEAGQRIILVIDEVHNLVGAGDAEGLP